MFEKRRDALIHELSLEAGKDPQQDRYLAGYIGAMNDILKVDVEEIDVD